MKIAIIGAGNVGGALGRAWAARGHEVCFGVRDPAAFELAALISEIGPNAGAGSALEAARSAGVLVLATPWPAAEDAVRSAGDLSGKIVIDCTNPLTADASALAVGHTSSGAEHVARWARGASVFKALNQAGFNIMSDPVLDGRRAVMFVCGDDAERKPVVLKLVGELGFEALDTGDLSKARLLEPLAMLWIHLAYRQKLGRDFAFGLLRSGPASARP